MRNTRNEQKGSVIKMLACMAVISLAAFCLNSYFGAFLNKVAVFSAGLALPEGSVSVIKNQLTDNNAKIDINTESSVISVAESPSDSSEKTVSASNEVYKTPADIILMAQEFKLNYAESEHSGNITEKEYDASNATDVFENITVRNTTPSHSIDIQASLNSPLELNVSDKAQPTVLIFHTHTTEAYEMLDEGWFTNAYSTRSQDPKRNMVRVGDAICEELEKNGIGYIHDTEIHDLQYTGAYERSRQSISAILEKYPSIQIVLDVHRDAIHQSETARVKPVAQINGKKAAQVMIIAGCEDGKVSSFPNWEKNLTFALRLQKTAETMYPGYMRPILFSARKYNMDVVPCSVLLEFGSDSNTLSEAEYSGHLMGSAIAKLIEENTKEQ
jgi:stage II sporulation protein P